MTDDIDDDALAGAGREEQLEAMEIWFRERFEDPAQRTPYESAEGGYIWIWGGPFDAEDQLSGRFHGTVPDDVIDELVAKLEEECNEWAPTPQPGDYDEGLFEAVSGNVAARETLSTALQIIDTLRKLSTPTDTTDAFLRLLFANAITSLETYLSDTFINLVSQDEVRLQKYLESDPNLKDRKIPLRDILLEASRIDETVRKELLDIVWHNLGKVKPLYSSVLGVDLGEINAISVAIQKRHDIVHRNGRRKNGEIVAVTPGEIEALCDAIDELASRIEVAIDASINNDPSSDF